MMDTLDRPIAFHRVFVSVTGSITAALMLSQAIYWSRRTKDQDGWFYKTIDEWQEETGLTRHEQAGARKMLKKLGFWQEKLKGVPAITHYRVDAEILQTSLPLFGKLDSRIAADKIGSLPQTNTETTTETTTSSTTSVVDESSVKLPDFEIRKEKFRKDMLHAGGMVYTKQMLDNFFGYWTEPNGAAKPRMRWEVTRRKGWDMNRRLKSWARNNLDKIVCHLTDSQKTIKQKQHEFSLQLEKHLEKYSRDTLNAFWKHWAQPENKPEPTLLRWESEEFWDLAKRLSQWAARNPQVQSGNPPAQRHPQANDR